MKIRLLKEGYKKDELLYTAFKNGDVLEDLFSEEIVEIEEAPDFPIYMGKGSEVQKKADFLAAFQTIANSYVNWTVIFILMNVFGIHFTLRKSAIISLQIILKF